MARRNSSCDLQEQKEMYAVALISTILLSKLLLKLWSQRQRRHVNTTPILKERPLYHHLRNNQRFLYLDLWPLSLNNGNYRAKSFKPCVRLSELSSMNLLTICRYGGTRQRRWSTLLFIWNNQFKLYYRRSDRTNLCEKTLLLVITTRTSSKSFLSSLTCSLSLRFNHKQRSI